MRIGLDATTVPEQITGAGYYVVNLCRSLTELDPENQYLIFANQVVNRAFGNSLAGARIRARPFKTRIERILWEQAILPAQIREERLEVFHSPHYTMPLSARCASVVTFHDMTFFLYPQMHTLYKRIFFRTMMRITSLRASAIIVDSESTRHDLIKILKIDEKRVFAVPLGVSASFRRLADRFQVEEISRKYKLPERFILYVGVLEPRKNLSTLTRAFKLLIDRGLKHTLVIAGRKGWFYDDLFKTIEDLNLKAEVILTGYIPDEELPFLYNAADLFVYPSLYEGFGLPVLEAMACGVPVITSNISSLPEIVGAAGVLVNPNEINELADKIYNVLTDRQFHDELGNEGLARSRLFSWARTAKETLAVYRQVLNAR